MTINFASYYFRTPRVIEVTFQIFLILECGLKKQKYMNLFFFSISAVNYSHDCYECGVTFLI